MRVMFLAAALLAAGPAVAQLTPEPIAGPTPESTIESLQAELAGLRSELEAARAELAVATEDDAARRQAIEVLDLHRTVLIVLLILALIALVLVWRRGHKDTA